MSGSKKIPVTFLIALIMVSAFVSGCVDDDVAPQSIQAQEEAITESKTITVTDSVGRTVDVPKNPGAVICSGGGALRYLTYLEAQGKIVAVDSMEYKVSVGKAYAVANNYFEDYPTFGKYGGENLEAILTLDPQPEVIFQIYAADGYDPDELQDKTGIPVVALAEGDMVEEREDMYQVLRIMGEVMDKGERAEEVISFMDAEIADLNERTVDVPDEEKISCYAGGVGSSGSYDFLNTDSHHPSLYFINAKNVAYNPDNMSVEKVSKESILVWDPEIIFLELRPSMFYGENYAPYQLEHDETYHQLSAFQNGNVYGVLPYKFYSHNPDTALVDAYFAGTILFPEQFEDVTVEDKAAEIYGFLVCEGDEEKGKSVFETMLTISDTPAYASMEFE
ncbi:ABC-type Fe3+-hydroxamate transport system, periplasmic component [Methanolobus tindarius DSM 2278]|uniref:ABC-type Fe3+-hydroxamate transport system, periplasmic component n=1 Tax=Methanolobus tindarius DSM 2278 TaxID=1090322 RepID=W9DP09_METTI|nr:ABC transporter substrate-binding protein [Methanolobus tindarius]ETA66838.1 ABC-type Fe3+-hydroxamate transport system, periplasmic component [Methanolobus tindarius DSM 2278]